MQKSPSGRVPVLEFDDKIISGSDVCSDYLDETYAQNKLCPDDPYLRAQLKIHRDPFGPVSCKVAGLLVSYGISNTVVLEIL